MKITCISAIESGESRFTAPHSIFPLNLCSKTPLDIPPSAHFYSGPYAGLLRSNLALRTRAPGSQGEDQGTPAQPSHTGSRRRTHDASGPGCPGNSVPAGYQCGTRSFPPRCMPTPLLALRYSQRGSWQAASLLFGSARVSLLLPLLPTRHSGSRRVTQVAPYRVPRD
jgi:hypothetical protein